MSSPNGIQIRVVTLDDDLAELGRIVRAAYTALPGHPPVRAYEDELLDVPSRVRTNTVFGAFDAAPRGCVTFVRDASEPNPEDLRRDEASFRMLGVSPGAQGRGVGQALVRRCLDEASSAGRRPVFIYSGDWMVAAHRLYERMGFVRVPERDWTPGVAAVDLLAFTRDLAGRC